jgi:MFS family permease
MRSFMRENGIRTISIVTGGHFLSHFYILTLPPLFPALRIEFGLSNAELGLLLSVISFATLLQIPVGWLVDRIGAKRVFVTGIALTSLGILLAGTATTYYELVGFALLSGIGQAAFHPADYPLLEVASDPRQRGWSFSLHTFGGYAGFATAPVVVGTVESIYAWESALLLVGSAGLGYALLSLVTLTPIYRNQIDATDDQDAATAAPDIRSMLRSGMAVMFALFVCSTFASKGIQSFTPIVAIDGFQLTETVGNMSLTGFYTLTAIGILGGGILADRYDPRRTITVLLTFVALVLWFTISGFVPGDPRLLIGSFSIIGFAYGLTLPSRDRIVSELSVAGSTGRSFGFVFTGTAIGGIISPLLLGRIIDLSTVTVAFVLIGGFFLASGLLVLLIGSRRDRDRRISISVGD